MPKAPYTLIHSPSAAVSGDAQIPDVILRNSLPSSIERNRRLWQPRCHAKSDSPVCSSPASVTRAAQLRCRWRRKPSMMVTSQPEVAPDCSRQSLKQEREHTRRYHSKPGYQCSYGWRSLRSFPFAKLEHKESIGEWWLIASGASPNVWRKIVEKPRVGFRWWYRTADHYRCMDDPSETLFFPPASPA